MILTCILLLAISTTPVVSVDSLSQSIIKNEVQVPQKDDSVLDILLVSAPAIGHLIPLSRLGQELTLRGHRVSLCTTVVGGWNVSKEIVQRHDISFISAGLDPHNRYDKMGTTLRPSM